MVGEIRIADGRADLQAAVGRRFDLVERQTVDVEQPRRRFDVQLHQVEQRRAAGDEPHVRALLRGLRLARRPRSPLRDLRGRMNSKVCMRSLLRC